MNLQGIDIHLVRNEFEYDKIVAPAYRKKYSWEESKASTPWVVVDFSCTNSTGDIPVELSFSPDADFSGINPNDVWEVADGGKILKVNLKKTRRIMFELHKDLGITDLPPTLTVKAKEDGNTKVYSETFYSISLTDTDATLKWLDEQYQGGGNQVYAKLIGEVVMAARKQGSGDFY